MSNSDRFVADSVKGDEVYDARGNFLGAFDEDGALVPAAPAEPVPFDRASHQTQRRLPDGTFGPTLSDAEIDALETKALEEGVKELPDAKLDELIAKAKEEKRRREQDPMEYD